MKKNREFRRAGAKKRLEAQLETGLKGKEPLEKKDINRINKELEVLSGSYKGYQKTNKKY
jgi:hypothetical protein